MVDARCITAIHRAHAPSRSLSASPEGARPGVASHGQNRPDQVYPQRMFFDGSEESFSMTGNTVPRPPCPLAEKARLFTYMGTYESIKIEAALLASFLPYDETTTPTTAAPLWLPSGHPSRHGLVRQGDRPGNKRYYRHHLRCRSLTVCHGEKRLHPGDGPRGPIRNPDRFHLQSGVGQNQRSLAGYQSGRNGGDPYPEFTIPCCRNTGSPFPTCRTKQ